MLEPCSIPPPRSASNSATPVWRDSLEPRVVLGGDQPRKDHRPAGSYRKVVIALADGSSAIFGDPKPPTFGAVVGRQLLQLNDAVDDAVGGLVRRFGSQIVEQQHGRAPTGEIVLDRQKLPPISQRALREKADLGQTVEDYPDRLRALKRREYRLVVSPSSRSEE